MGPSARPGRVLLTESKSGFLPKKLDLNAKAADVRHDCLPPRERQTLTLSCRVEFVD